jgi:hypothetical protein
MDQSVESSGSLDCWSTGKASSRWNYKTRNLWGFNGATCVNKLRHSVSLLFKGQIAANADARQESYLQSWSIILAHLTLTVRNLTPTSITSIAIPPFPRSMLCVVCYTSKVLHNIDKGDRGCLDMKFCIKWTSMYMVIRNEVKVMLFRLSAPRIFDQDWILVNNVGALDTDCAKFDSHINNKHSNPPFPPFNVVCSVLNVQGVTHHW